MMAIVQAERQADEQNSRAPGNNQHLLHLLPNFLQQVATSTALLFSLALEVHEMTRIRME